MRSSIVEFLLVMCVAGVALGAEKQPPALTPAQGGDPAVQLDPNGKVKSIKGHALGFKPAKEKHGRMWFEAKVGTLPDNYDLRTLGLVPPIKDQGQCGSCWAFASTGAFESALLKSGRSFDLAEQQLVSCDATYAGCDGGDFAFDYERTSGQVLSSQLPYTSGAAGVTGVCPNTLPSPAAKATAWSYVGSPTQGPTVDQLRQAILAHGAVAISVCADNWNSVGSDGQVACGCSNVDHLVQAVGWLKQSDKSFKFIVKNQWSTAWGDHGYAYIPLGCDALGSEAAFVIAPSAPCQPPIVRLPASVTASPGVPITLSLASPQSGVTYGWTDQIANKKVASGPSVTLTPHLGTSVYKLWGRNACGTSTSTEKIVVN